MRFELGLFGGRQRADDVEFRLIAQRMVHSH